MRRGSTFDSAYVMAATTRMPVLIAPTKSRERSRAVMAAVMTPPPRKRSS